MKLLQRVNFRFDKLSGLYLWLTFIVVFGVWKPSLFLTADTVHLIASEQVIVAIVALAALIPIACGCYDLSVGATVNFTAILVSVLQTTDHWSLGLSIVLSVVIGTVFGVVNGFIVVVLRVNSFIATLGTATVIAAFQTIVSGGNQPLPPTGATWIDLTQKQVGGFQVIVLYLVVIALVAWWMMEHTPVGRYIYATGSNREAARLSGVAVGKWTWFSLILSGSLSGVAGILYASLSGPSLTFGAALLLPAFAAVYLGSTQLKPGKFNVWGTLIAVYALATGVTGLQFVTGVQWLSDMFNGVALVAAVAFAISRQQKRSGRRRDDQGSLPVEPPLPTEDDEPLGAELSLQSPLHGSRSTEVADDSRR